MSGDTAPAPPRAGRRRLFSWLIVACVLVLAVGLVAAQFVKSPAQVAAETAPPPLTVLTAPVEQRVLSSTVAMEGVVRTRSTVTVAVPAGGDSGSSVVTAVKVKRGQQVRPGTVLLEVSDRPLIVLEGAIPAYRDLGPGSSGGDVARLQQSLHWLGYGTGADREGSYGAGTSGAVARLYEDRGYQARHAAEAPTDDDGNRTAARSGGVMVPAAEVIFLQSFPARVQQVTTSVGGTGGGSAMRLASGDLVVEATVAQVDGESIVEGQRASIIFDDGRDQRARVRTVRPVSGGASADAEDADVSEAQYAVTARPAGELAARELGQQVRLVVVTGATNGAVLALPVAAISTDESGTSYVTVVTGSGAERRVDVVAGFFADGYVEVTPVRGQLGVGDQARLGSPRLVNSTCPRTAAVNLPSPDGADAVLAFEGVARTYPGPPPVHALVAFDLVVRRGRFVTIAGPSGSGKSTLLNIMGLLDRPSAGTLWVDGRDSGVLSEGDRAALRGHSIGFVFQAYHLMAHRTLLENVMIGGLYQGVPRRTRERNSLQALDRVGLADRAHSLTGHLSGGQRQRVAVARALVTDPSLILCDEPTGNLDSHNAAEVIRMLQRLHSEGMTVILVTHDSGLAALGQQQVTIADGVVRDAA